MRIYAERGATDLAVTSGLSPVGVVPVLLGNGDGTFRSALTYGAGSAPASLAVGDLNGDGKPDLAIADDFSNNVLVLLNTYVAGSGGSACAPVAASGN